MQLILVFSALIILLILFIKKEREYDYNNKNYVSDYLPWGYLIKDDEEGIIFNKNGSFQKTFKFIGKDVDSMDKTDLIMMRAKINNAIKKLNDNWVINIEARRTKIKNYEKSEYKSDFLKKVDEIRSEKYNNGNYYENNYYITFSWLTPPDIINKFKSKLIETNAKNNEEKLIVIKDFKNNLNEVISLLNNCFTSIIPLNNKETISYLHSCISKYNNQEVEPMNYDVMLDAYLSDTTITDGMPPKVGDEYIGAVSILSFPNSTFPSMFDEINELDFEYRWNSRYILIEKKDALKIAQRIRGKWSFKRKNLLTTIDDKISKNNTEFNAESSNRVSEAEDFISNVQNDDIRAGYYTFSILIKDKDIKSLRKKEEKVLNIIQSKGFIGIIENINVLETYFGSMPNDINHNVRKFLVPSTTVIDLMQFSTVWSGEKYNNHLKDKPLFYASSSERLGKKIVSSIVYYNLHVGDVGHTSIFGKTGGGKSVLLCFLASQFMKYKDSQVFFFDKGGSSKVLSNVVGGKFYNLGEDYVSFQPLAGVGMIEENIEKNINKIINEKNIINQNEIEKIKVEETEKERVRADFEKTWASEWLKEIFMQENIILKAEHNKSINEALNSLANLPQNLRTLTQLSIQIQHSELRDALLSYTKDGVFGKYFDSNKDFFNTEYPYQFFETEKIMQLKKACPIMLNYIFHKLEVEMFSKGKPTILILDECWSLLDNEYFSAKIKEWLKVLRKKNVSVVFATQEINDVLKSSIKDTLIASCPTTIYLANQKAGMMDKEIYESLGLNNKQIKTITNLKEKKDYYSVSSKGNMVFNLGLSEFELSVLGASSTEKQIRCEDIKNSMASLNLDSIEYANEFFHRWIQNE